MSFRSVPVNIISPPPLMIFTGTERNEKETKSQTNFFSQKSSETPAALQIFDIRRFWNFQVRLTPEQAPPKKNLKKKKSLRNHLKHREHLTFLTYDDFGNFSSKVQP